MNLLHQLLGIGEAAIGMHPAANGATQALQGAGGPIAAGLQSGGGIAQGIQSGNHAVQALQPSNLQPMQYAQPMQPGPGASPQSMQLYHTLLQQLQHIGQPQFSQSQVHQSLYSANNPQANQLGGDFGTPIQGQQNPGYIPMQGSRGPMGNAVGLQNAYLPMNNQNQQFGGGNITF
jgi:hypothetical protein